MPNKDWTGNKAAVFVCNGATGHAKGERENNDYYATDPIAAEYLLKLEPQLNNIWENAVGEGNLAEVFRKAGKLKVVSDLIDRGYYPEGILTSYGRDFLKLKKIWPGDIVTNPPYASSLDWVKHSLDLLNVGRYLVLFMKITFLEGKERKKFFMENPPIRVWVSSSRIPCAKNNEFVTYKKDKYGNFKLDKEGNKISEKVSSAACYCWYVWQKGYKGDTVVKWFN